MDYEKLHKDTITNLQEMVNSGKITVEIARKICADFVPESEDEMTRQEMLAMFSNADDYGLEKEFVKRAIAYLEKQGEQILANPVKTYKDKQKPADKVWPKFNVGDWVVVDDGRIGRIIKCYKYFADVDLEFSRLSTNVNNIRSWTIQDAKDGDVLATLDHILIFEKLLPKDGGVSYCHYDFGCSTPQFNFNKDDNWYFGKEAKVYPATEEQRDFLFQKMHEAGYVWDAELKQLKKIKQQNIYKNGVYQEANGVRIWHNGHTFLVPKDWNKGEWPLLNKKGKENSKQNKKRLMNEMNALLDWDFVAATKHIQDLGTNIPLKDEEYLITAPVWLAMYEHRIELNKALNNIGAMEIDFNKTQWFAQRSYINRAWFFYGISGSLENSRVTFAFQVGIIML